MSSLRSFSCIALLALTVRASATTQYVVVNNGSYIANSANLYKLDRATGSLKKMATLYTGGKSLQLEAVFYHTEQAATDDGGCIYVFDDWSSDVAAFSKATSYKRVGKYFKEGLLAGDYAGSLALAPSGRFLYSSYSESGYIALWKVNADCTLTFIAAYSDNGSLGPMRVTPNGKYLVSSSGGTLGWAALYAIDGPTGGLTRLNFLSFGPGICARTTFCFPQGLDITADSKLAVFSSTALNYYENNVIPVALTARITRTGLANPHVRVLKESSDLRLNNFPFLSAAGYKGSGSVYFGVLGNDPGYNSGILTAAFTERPIAFTVTNQTITNPQVGNIAVTGNLMVVAQYPGQISVFRILKDGSLRLLSTTVDEQGAAFSLSIFPNTR